MPRTFDGQLRLAKCDAPQEENFPRNWIKVLRNYRKEASEIFQPIFPDTSRNRVLSLVIAIIKFHDRRLIRCMRELLSRLFLSLSLTFRAVCTVTTTLERAVLELMFAKRRFILRVSTKWTLLLRLTPCISKIATCPRKTCSFLYEIINKHSPRLETEIVVFPNLVFVPFLLRFVITRGRRKDRSHVFHVRGSVAGVKRWCVRQRER